MVTACVCLLKGVLDFSFVLDASFEDEPAPVDGEYPANDINSSEHLDDSDCELSLAPGAWEANT